MKKLLKILGIIGLVFIGLYLISIPYLRSKNVVKESVFFTPTKYDTSKIFNQLDSKYLTNISKNQITEVASEFITDKGFDSIQINGTTVKREFKEFAPNSNSEFYIIKPTNAKKAGIFMLGNQFNVFNMLDDLTELSKRDSTEIYVITYNGNGYSTGESNFKTQFAINQSFYDFINKQHPISFIAGHSLGTVFATKLAVDNKIPTLALLAPASNIEDIATYFKSLAPFWARPYLNFNEIKESEIAKLGNTSENIKSYYGKLILSHGTKDENLPFSMSAEILKNCPSKNKELIKIENGDHYAPLVGNNWDKIMNELK